MQTSERVTLIAILVLACACAIVWMSAWQGSRGELRVSFLDIGQGDAIFIQAPNGMQALIDGGPDTTVLRRLAQVMPWYDRSIDLVIGTHPDLDHIGGLIDVLPRYSVSTVIVPSVEGTTDAWRTYLKEVGDEHAHVIDARRGERIMLGSAYLDVLFPDRDTPGVETNTGCIVTRLVYKSTSFLLPCDSPQNVEKYLAALDGSALKSDVLKAGHHGSKTSSAPIFVGEADPKFAIFSRGCNNKYGHPNQETIDTFNRFGVPVDDTCKEGTVTYVSDGQTVRKE